MDEDANNLSKNANTFFDSMVVNMIWESHFWKDDLLKKAAKLRKNTTQKRWSEASLAQLEQTLMLGFYSIRKLQEAAKLSTATGSQQISLIAFSWIQKNVTKLNWHKLDELYDFTSSFTETRDLKFICDQFIHSFVFTAYFGENRDLDGIFFASDRQRHKALFGISISQIIVLFEHVGNDYPDSETYSFNPKTGDYDVLAS